MDFRSTQPILVRPDFFVRIDSLCFNLNWLARSYFRFNSTWYLMLDLVRSTRLVRLYLVRPDLMIWFKSTKFVLFRVCFAILDYFWFDPTRFGLTESILFDLTDSILRGLNRFGLTQSICQIQPYLVRPSLIWSDPSIFFNPTLFALT